MSAITCSPSDQIHDAAKVANAWLAEHHDELIERATACFAKWPPHEREEAVAEVVAMTAASAHRAAANGRLDRLTPYHCIRFGRRRFRSGRRMGGYNTTDVMSEATRLKRRVRVRSLEGDGAPEDAVHRPLCEVLADRDGADPAELVRQHIDYAMMLGDPAVSEKARATFVFLAATHGGGRQIDLAAELMVTAGRISQLKAELATVLARYGYHAPLGPRPAAH